MKLSLKLGFTTALYLVCATTTAYCHATEAAPEKIKATVDLAIHALMVKYQIPGMAVGITVAGKPYVFNYGVASKETQQAVSDNTLFELGSISKTFTATLASYAQVHAYLSLSDVTSKYLPALNKTPFGQVSLLNLGTHTPGGLPLQVPDNIQNDEQLLEYFKKWHATYSPGTYRTYANPGIGTLGLITAKSMKQDFTVLMENRMFPALGLTNTYIDVPTDKMADYAQGYNKENRPVRMQKGVLSAEAYGVKSNAGDVLHFLQVNMNPAKLHSKLQRAITDTHTGYFQAGEMTQDLIWEQYSYPVALTTLLKGNSPELIYEATAVTKILPPQKPREDVWIVDAHRKLTS